MHRPAPIRISREGGMGRADLTVDGVAVTVLSSRPADITSAALALRSLAEPFDPDRGAAVAAAATRAAVLVRTADDIATAGTAPAGGWIIRMASGPGSAPAQMRMYSGGLVTVRSASPGSVWRRVTVAARSWRTARAAASTALDQGEGAGFWLESVGLIGCLVRPDGTVELAGQWAEDRADAA